MSARLVAVGIAVVALYACGGNRQPTAPTPPVTTAPTPTPTPPVATVPPPAPTPPVVPTVRGMVFDFQTQKPISGVAVRFRYGSFPSTTDSTVTDTNGRYSLPQPPSSQTEFYVHDRQVGLGYPRADEYYRADLAVNNGTCITRYGMVMETRTLRPVVGVTLLSTSNTVLATTDSKGWYQKDWGCPIEGHLGFNTTFMVATHPNYQSQQVGLGRGISGVYRHDIVLQPR